jgi:rubrerythrin
MPDPDHVAALVDAMDQLLDDMGATGKCVCLYAKAQARIAFEPFRTADHTTEFTLEAANQIVARGDSPSEQLGRWRCNQCKHTWYGAGHPSCWDCGSTDIQGPLAAEYVRG